MLNFAASVRVRITAAVTVIFAVALSMGAVGLVRQVESALRSDIQQRNAVVTTQLPDMLQANQLSLRVLTSPVGDLDSQLGQVDNPGVLREAISQSYIYATGPGVDEQRKQDSGLWSQLRTAASADPQPLFGQSMPSGMTPNRFYVSSTRIETLYGPVVLHVASSLDSVRSTVSRIAKAMLVAVPSLVALVGIMTWFMTGQALRPVESITRRVKAITGSTLHERVPEPKTDDEIGELARTMNAMLDRLERAATGQKRFMSDASHELRSPVASIRTQLETALLAGDATDWPEVAQTVLNEDERLGGLVDNMLAMARLEEDVRRQPVEVDLDEVVFDQTARPTRVTVDRSRVGAGRVSGVSQELASVVRNLFDNAVRHARSHVAISLATVGPWVRFSVDDDGPGVDPEDRGKVFERFARLQDGRARDSGGSGLGLALSKRIVETLGGRIFIESSPLGGASFVVELPAVLDEGTEV